jgi:hypothetical protein
VKDKDLLSFLQISQTPTEVVASNQRSDTQLLNVPCRYCYFDQLKVNLEGNSDLGMPGFPILHGMAIYLILRVPSGLDSKISHARYVGI